VIKCEIQPLARHAREPEQPSAQLHVLSGFKRRSPLASMVRIASTAFVLLLATELLHAEGDTAAQRRACEPDVFRLCKDFIPNPSAITSCLVRNKPRLSADCRAVFDGQLK
jgi:hypothetical protein